MRREVWLALALAGCGPAEPVCDLDPGECAIRQRLGVPPDATTVVILAQTAHLDVDWQKTFDDYYASYVDDVFTEALGVLHDQPRAYYGVAEMAYAQRHLQVHPEDEDAWRAAAERGALRVVGGGMTSPDTLLSEVELLARDDLYGLRFAEDVLGTTPRAAWLPDSFGQGATVPDMLSAAGWSSVAFSRVDGGQTQYEQLLHPGDPPPVGSTADVLRQAGSADFEWHGPGGGVVLAHYMAAPRLYCAGDNIDYAEDIQVPHGHLGEFRGDDPEFTDARIDQYVAEMEPWTRTPYVFVPVGCDFASPKDDLVAYADGYDARRYPDTGVWAVAAPFDDYADLVEPYRDDLPDVTGELSPYFMGFYGTRPEVKRRVREAARPFFVAETFATLLGDDGSALVRAAAPALTKLTRADHHDFVTGTATDDVTRDEQLPLLDEAEAAGLDELSQVAKGLAERITPDPAAIDRVLLLNASSAKVSEVVQFERPEGAIHARVGDKAVPLELVSTSGGTSTWQMAVPELSAFGWRTVDLLAGAGEAPTDAVHLDLLDADGLAATGDAVERVVLTNEHVVAEWDRADGRFALTSVAIDGEEALAAPSFVLGDYDDEGGLWRLGHEMAGCGFTPVAPAPAVDTVEIREDSALRVRVAFHSGDDVREAALDAGAAGLDLAVEAAASEGTTRTVSWTFAVDDGAPRRTSAPGGAVERAVEHVWSPTFWPAVAWAQTGPWALLLRQSTGVRFTDPGGMELIALRDARREGCDVLGGTGSDPDTHRIAWRIARADAVTDAEKAGQAWNRPVVAAVVGTDTGTTSLAGAGVLLTLDGEGIVSALKPAERGDGIILRVVRSGPMWVCPREPAARAWELSDLAERDGISLGLAGSTVTFDGDLFGSISTVRLR